MRIVIDMQGSQGESRFRGIGRYSLAIAQAIVKNSGDHEIILALNGLFPSSIEIIRAAFEGLLPQNNIRVWYAAGPIHGHDSANRWRRETAQLIRESFLASLEPDFVLITSIFEGYSDDAIHSIGLLSKNFLTAVVLYDLIPLIESDVYLKPNPTYENYYKNQLLYLSQADICLAISNSSRQEAITYLKIQPDQVINISTAADNHFKPITIDSADETNIRKRFKLTRPYLMCSGATDERKNHLRLIKAYSLLQLELRNKYQLAIVGGLFDSHRTKFEAYIEECGLTLDDVVITGRVTDTEMVRLYNLCNLFVFPSWHEGFGLPALEAMCCGAPVIGSNTTSLPEVIGRPDALFDPFDENSIARKIAEVLTNDELRNDLANHALEQAKLFSWDESAHRTIAAFEQIHIPDHKPSGRNCDVKDIRPKLAFISPLPPERSGISGYSADLLPELARYYIIDVIVSQEQITDAWVLENCAVHDVAWFIKNHDLYDRVLYQFGNSHFHQHMFSLLEQIPGIVVLHDFFLSGIVAHMDVQGIAPNSWNLELYHAHGFKAVQEHVHSLNWDNEVFKYPCNRTVLENAQGIIVHSQNSVRLASQWMGFGFGRNWSVIPLVRGPGTTTKRSEARKALGIKTDAFVICSFGMLHETKQNQRLLDAWLASSLTKDSRCILVFVGENHGAGYGEKLTATINNSGFSSRINITGWTDSTTFCHYLAAADMGVQLRTLSRGETSAAVLDCMNYGLPTIVNANGSMADLPPDAVWLLPDDFKDSELTTALETLWKDEDKQQAIGVRAREVIATQHSPQVCAKQYAKSIESYFEKAQSGVEGLVKQISQSGEAPKTEFEWLETARCISKNHLPHTTKQLLVDVSALVRHDLKTGIERVVRSVLAELLNNPPIGFRVEPVYATADELGYRYARQFTLRFLNCPDNILVDDHLETFCGDIFLGLDLQQHVVVQQAALLKQLKDIGVQTYFVIYDLLPVLSPHVFPEGASTMHTRWLNTVEKSDGVICISRAVADEMVDWLAVYGTERLRPLKLGWFHLGADVKNSAPSTGLPVDAHNVLKQISRRSTFLSVGTIEPRKGYLQTLLAFEKLWAQGLDINLVIVGHEGWKGLSEHQRRTIPLTVYNLLNHPECGKRLFWLEGISDEYLERIYAGSNCLIAASEGEGFGLPLIEAAQHKLPIIARDIQVFREVAGIHAFYFSGSSGDALASGIVEWLALDKVGLVPRSDTMPWATWKASTQNLLNVMLGGFWYKYWNHDGVLRMWGADSRLGSQVGKRLTRDMTTDGQNGYLIFGPYVPLAAGRYRVKVLGVVGDNGLNGANMDVACNGGGLILGKMELGEFADGCLAQLSISLDVSCTDLEIRVWVSKETNLKVSMIEIFPWENRQGSEGTVSENIDAGDVATNHLNVIKTAVFRPEVASLSSQLPIKMLPLETEEFTLRESTDLPMLISGSLDINSDSASLSDGSIDGLVHPQPPATKVVEDSSTALNKLLKIKVTNFPSGTLENLKPLSPERNQAKTRRKKKR